MWEINGRDARMKWGELARRGLAQAGGREGGGLHLGEFNSEETFKRNSTVRTKLYLHKIYQKKFINKMVKGCISYLKSNSFVRRKFKMGANAAGSLSINICK